MTIEAVVRRVVGEMLAQHPVNRHAIVSSVDNTRGVVKVQLDEDGTISGWLPVAQVGAGAGWSVVCLPTPGTQVFLAPDLNDASSMVVLGAVHSTQQPIGQVIPFGSTTPQPLTPGEVVLSHVSGVTLRLTNGAVEIHGNLSIAGNLAINGNMTITGTATASEGGDFIAGENAVSLATHRHESFGPNTTTSEPI